MGSINCTIVRPKSQWDEDVETHPRKRLQRSTSSPLMETYLSSFVNENKVNNSFLLHRDKDKPPSSDCFSAMAMTFFIFIFQPVSATSQRSTKKGGMNKYQMCRSRSNSQRLHNCSFGHADKYQTIEPIPEHHFKTRKTPHPASSYLRHLSIAHQK